MDSIGQVYKMEWTAEEKADIDRCLNCPYPPEICTGEPEYCASKASGARHKIDIVNTKSAKLMTSVKELAAKGYSLAHIANELGIPKKKIMNSAGYVTKKGLMTRSEWNAIKNGEYCEFMLLQVHETHGRA